MTSTSPLIHVIRHGEALHNIQRPYPDRDPPLTEAGHRATKGIKLDFTPDLILISPMTRTFQTALNIFPFLQSPSLSPSPEVQVWPDLRETHDSSPCNQGLPSAELSEVFPQFDFSECHPEWDYASHTTEGAIERAEVVRRRLKEVAGTGRYANIVIVTHRGFIAFLAKGRRFDVCERRTFRFATEKEVQQQGVRRGVNCDTLEEQDFGPSVLVLHEKKADWEIARDNF
ncbi:phosphoglycerate mutase-like protein [Massarina eburnea CBS 473.64]|uniref:Phosphoglycerate mutase-like protein n=1 Tax=Massarina eburnea CBS 473.64 TaxID=1395130 RepID=A0A6A6SD30_9PLEO|nr:phosphoglycerate mutase-like protein [Massarina eburnea CBS 473.64]